MTGQNTNVPQLDEPRINVIAPDLILDGYRKRVRTDLLRVWPAARADIERVDRLNLFRRKGEVEDGSPCLSDDPVLLIGISKLTLIEERVQFYLI